MFEIGGLKICVFYKNKRYLPKRLIPVPSTFHCMKYRVQIFLRGKKETWGGAHF